MAQQAIPPVPATEYDDTPAPKRPDHHGNADGPHEHGPRRRWLWRSVLMVVLLLILIVALLPTLLSSGPGTRFLVARIQPYAGGTLEIDDLSLGWFSGQSATGVHYRQDGGVLAVDIGDLRAHEVTLFHLLIGGRQLGTIDLDNVLVVYAVPDPDSAPARPQSQPVSAPASSPRQAAEPAPTNPPAPQAEPKPFSLPRDFAVTVNARGVEVLYSAPQMQPVRVSSASSSVSVVKGVDLGVDIDASVQQGGRIGRLSLKGDVFGIADADGRLQPILADYQVAAEASNLPIDGLSRALAERRYANPTARYLLGKRGRLAAILGGEKLDARAALKGTPNQIEADVSVQTENLEAALPLRRLGQRVVVSSDEAMVDWLMTPAGFSALFEKSGLTLNRAVHFASRTIEADLPRKGRGIDLDASGLSLVLVGDDATMTDKLGREILVEGLRLGVTSEALSKLVAARLEATVTAPDETGEMVAGALQVDLRGQQLFTPNREISFISKKLPILLVDALGGFEDDLVVWLGATLNLDIIVQGGLVEDAEGARVVYDFSLSPDSSRIAGELPGRIDGRRITGATPDQEPIEIQLRPAGFARLMSMLSGDRDKPLLRFAGDQSMTAYVTINQTSYGPRPARADADKALYFFPEQLYTDITIELSPATVVDPRKGVTYELRGGTINAKIVDRQLAYTVDVDLWVPEDAGRAGFGAALTLQTTVFDLLDTTGKLPLTKPAFVEQIRLDGGIDLDHTPSALFDTLLERDGDLAAVLGPVVDDLEVQFQYAHGKPTGASIRLNWDDRIDAPLDGAWASMRPLELNIDDKGMMTIADGKDVTIELRVHPELGDRWMGQLHPILFDAQSGDRPVQVTIKGDTFRFPIGQGSMKGANVEAMVDLGSLEFAEDALLARLMSWAGHSGERAVFNPARVKLADGLLSYEELDLSVGNVQLRFDGKVDLESGQIVDMAMRVPGSSLVKVFNELEGVVPADDFLSIPMSGSLRQPKFDRTLITREVTRMLTENARRRLGDRVREEIGVDPDSPEGEAIEGGFDFIRRRLEQHQQQNK